MNDFTNASVIFTEKQRCGPTWLYVPLLLLPGAFTLWVWNQIFGKTPWSNPHFGDPERVLAFAWGVLILSLVLTSAVRLVTVVDRQGIGVQLWPFWSRYIHMGDIHNSFVRKCRPLFEYGGWGVRLSWKGWAYILGSSRGVQLELDRGFPVFIGSQRCDELLAAIQQAKAAAAV
jgi:hypothetical protein